MTAPSDLLAAESLIAECRAFLLEWRATVRTEAVARLRIELAADEWESLAKRAVVLALSYDATAMVLAEDVVRYRRAYFDMLHVGTEQCVTIAHQQDTIARLRESLDELRDERSTWQRITRSARQAWAERLFGRTPIR